MSFIHIYTKFHLLEVHACSIISFSYKSLNTFKIIKKKNDKEIMTYYAHKKVPQKASSKGALSCSCKTFVVELRGGSKHIYACM